MKNSFTEENYIKAIYQLTNEQQLASTTDIADMLGTKASSVTDMLKRLKEKKLADYQRYKGVSLTKKGQKIALGLIRKHRLWETFLVKKLNFEWHQVHELAEELEHIKSEDLINRLDDFLDQPKFDPHGDPIPDRNFKILEEKANTTLSELNIGKEALIIGVSNTNDSFLQYLNDINISLGTKIKCLQKFDFDNTMQISVAKKEIMLSEKVSQSIIIKTA